MLHQSSGYRSLVERLNRFPQGAPASELLTKILALLVNEREASLLSQLPVRPFSPAAASYLWGIREVEAFRLLENLADRALLLDAEHNGEKLYLLPPPWTGFLQYCLMKVRGDLDQKRLCELLYQYLNLEQEFSSALFSGSTQVCRIMVSEDEIPLESQTRVRDYERASEVIRQAWKIAVGQCYCRHKMRNLGRACSALPEACLTFDTVADSLIRHGQAREIDRFECLDLLQQAREQNLVQIGENVQDGVSMICNCCGCCCELLVAARKFDQLQPVHKSNFIAGIRQELCCGCGRCVDVCPVEALNLVSANDPLHPRARKTVPTPERCLGCGACARVCKSGGATLEARPEPQGTPEDTCHRTVLMALERGTLQHLIWDRHNRPSHRALASLAGAVLKLPAVQRSLAGSDFASRQIAVMLKKRNEDSLRELVRYRDLQLARTQ